MATWLGIAYIVFMIVMGMFALIALLAGDLRGFAIGGLFTWLGYWLVTNAPDHY